MKNLFNFLFSLKTRSDNAISAFKQAASDLDTIAKEADLKNVKEEKAIIKARKKADLEIAKKQTKVNDNAIMAAQNRVVSKNLRFLMTQDIENATSPEVEKEVPESDKKSN